MGAGGHAGHVVAANFVPVEHWRPVFVSVMAVAPTDNRHDHRIEFEALVSQPIFASVLRTACRCAIQHAFAYQRRQPVRNDGARYAQALLKIVKTAHTQKAVAQDHQCPTVANHRKAPRNRTGHSRKLIPSHTRLTSKGRRFIQVSNQYGVI